MIVVIRAAYFVLSEDSLKARSSLETNRKASQKTEGMTVDLKGIFVCNMGSSHFCLLLPKREMHVRNARARKN